MLLLLERSDWAAVRINHGRLMVDFETSHPTKEKRLEDLTTGCNKCINVRLCGTQKRRRDFGGSIIFGHAKAHTLATYVGLGDLSDSLAFYMSFRPKTAGTLREHWTQEAS